LGRFETSGCGEAGLNDRYLCRGYNSESYPFRKEREEDGAPSLVWLVMRRIDKTGAQARPANSRVSVYTLTFSPT
jgi:hypothetical protein